jgi:alginate O-acetyltransferase complex protein AlgI
MVRCNRYAQNAFVRLGRENPILNPIQFNSFPFILVFLPVTVLGFYLLSFFTRRDWALAWLLVSSLIFYALGGPGGVPLLLCSVIFNWYFGKCLASPTPKTLPFSRLTLLKFAISVNLILLVFFKYSNFVLANLTPILGTTFRPIALALPLGISFFTLQQIIYLVDAYEGLTPGNNLRDHALFVTMFPYISMGPIIHSNQVLPQLKDPSSSRIGYDCLARGAMLFAVGLFKKVVFADSFGRLATAGYDGISSLSALEAWISTLSYSLQIYYDFSGYSDMAVAVALMLGLAIPNNFNSPYLSRSIVEFWKRWHISLSNFITNYLYTPMIRASSRGRVTMRAAMIVTFLSMIIAGLWHGPSWTFVIFGALHGVALVINQYWKKSKRTLHPFIAWVLTMSYVNIAFIFFRAPDAGSAFQMIGAMLGRFSFVGMEAFKKSIRTSEIATLAIPLLAGGIVIVLRHNSKTILDQFKPTHGRLACAVVLMLVSILFLNSNIAKEFIYFAF